MERRLPTWEELYAWASNKPENESIGIACASCKCPIAIYQREKYRETWTVGACGARPLDQWGILIRPEDWHVNVIKLVDSLPGAVSSDVPVTAKLFREMLKSLKP